MQLLSGRRHFTILAVVLLPFTLLRAQAPYYVSTRGDDTHDGRTPATAWRTLAKAGSVQLGPGDRVLLERGGLWRENLRLSGSGASGEVIEFGAYGGAAGAADPVIDLGGALPGWSTAGNWHSEGGNIWSYTATDFGDPGPGRLWLDGREQRISGSWHVSVDDGETPPPYDDARKYHGTGSGWGTRVPNDSSRFWYDNAAGNHTLYLYASSNPASAYSAIEVSNLLPAHSWAGKSYVTFRHLQFRRGRDCIALDNCDYFTFDSCRLGWGSPGEILWVRNASDHGVITHSSFNRSDSLQHTWEFSGSAMTNEGRNDGLAIQCGSYWEVAQDTFLTCGHAGVSVNGRTDESCSGTPSGHTESKYNKIHNCVFSGGGDYDRAWGCVCIGDYRLCAYNEFFSNLVTGCATQPTVNGGENRVYYNVFANLGWIPYSLPQDAWRSHGLLVGDFNVASKDCYHPQVFNNTFLNTPVAALMIADGPMHASIKNNLFYNCGARNNPFEPYTAIAFWPGATSDTIQNNIIYSPKASATVLWQSYIWNTSPTFLTVTQLNAQSGAQQGTNRQVTPNVAWAVANVISGNLGLDPELQSDFRIAPTSPAKDAGLPVCLTQDFFGTPIPPAARPDIGACEIAERSVEGR